MRDELTLVNHGQRRKRTKIEKIGRLDAKSLSLVERPLANHIKLALKRLNISTIKLSNLATTNRAITTVATTNLAPATVALGNLATTNLAAGNLVALPNKHLSHRWHGPPRDVAAFAFHDRDCAPAKKTLPLFGDDALEGLLAGRALFAVERQEHHPDAILAARRKCEAELRAFLDEEIVRDLDQYAGAVSGPRIASARAAMGQVVEHLQRLGDDVM